MAGAGDAEGGSERWRAAMSNLSQMGECVDSLQRLLIHKAVYMDEETFALAAGNARQARTSMAQERRIKALERDLDAAISAARHAREEKKEAENAQRSAEARCRQAIEELENTTQVFKLHLEELRSKQQELASKDSEIQVLKAIIETLNHKGNKQ